MAKRRYLESFTLSGVGDGNFTEQETRLVQFISVNRISGTANFEIKGVTPTTVVTIADETMATSTFGTSNFLFNSDVIPKAFKNIRITNNDTGDIFCQAIGEENI